MCGFGVKLGGVCVYVRVCVCVCVCVGGGGGMCVCLYVREDVKGRDLGVI